MAERVVIVGGSGFLGTHLSKRLIELGYEVVVVDIVSPKIKGVSFVEADITEGIPPHRYLEKPNFIINLAGTSIFSRWTKSKLESIYESRVRGTKVLVNLFEDPNFRPQALINASSVAIYGDIGIREVDERGFTGQGFSARVAHDWEVSARMAERYGVRTTIIRNAYILGNGGLLKFLKPFLRIKLAPVLGSGQQIIPWIHIEDIVSLYLLAIQAPNIPVIVNAVAPDVTTNGDLMRKLAKKRNAKIIKIPEKILVALVGKFGQELLFSQCVRSKVLQNSNFSFKYPLLEKIRGDFIS